MSNLAKTLESIHHPFKPIKDSNSKILILGSFPSVASREQDFYYSHPRNRFWEVLGRLFEYKDLRTKNHEEKITFLLTQKIALYDVCAECTITKSSDGSIKNPKPILLESLLQNTQIQHIFLNGKKAAQIYQKAFKDSKVTSLPHTTLPSTSPANAKWNLERLCQEWRAILIALRNKNEIH
ncbi:DNA-deoxyinosine glycosylase [Helicobacter sp. UBA3407]|uniref:DNA-deoxyinosine glycosylase n=1 Tax=Helicobacter sp. UBA3407 TaxID=1946588 RepID=UPI00263923E3|nr:DNA-deoxyinosine glycosylase [Helicobacter sp. UBA3407]